MEHSVRIIAHKLPYARMRRLRTAWFLLGSACGMAAGFMLGAVTLSGPSPATVVSEVSEPASATVSAREIPTETVKAAAHMPVELKKPDTPAPVALHQPELDLPAALSLRVDQGDTLISILTDTGVTFEEAHAAVQAIREIFDPRRLDAGAEVAITLDARKDNPKQPMLTSLSMPISRTAVVEVKRKNGGDYGARKIEAPVEKHTVLSNGKILSSFYETAQAAGIPPETINSLIKVYSYDVDFQRDIQRGDTLEVLMERTQTKDGIVTGYGNVLYASLRYKGGDLSVYRYTDKSGYTDYYTAKGESLRKALLRTPINGARITSGFGMRNHPILGYSKMHRGVDFGASAGTPIYAAGDGVIVKAGFNGSYGNYVRIRHNDKYDTAYAHASRIASGIRPGARVKQGQIIAYVGTTGRSTGPHLHYELLANGTQINPSGIKFKTGTTLAGKELKQFKQQIKDVQLAVAERAKRNVASAR